MTLPPAGSPGLMASVDDSGTLPGSTTQDLRVWKFAVDWSTTPNPTATFGIGPSHTPNFTVEVAPFTRPECVRAPAGDCVPQKGGPQTLDVLGDRVMNRLAYRNYGTHEAFTFNHSVKVDVTADLPVRIGVRWYEVRNPHGVGGPPVIRQQGTYAPADPPTNPLWRWMGSAAMDRDGNLAVGYSASGPNDFPSVRYAGRLESDPLNQLPQSEQALPAPYGGPQTQVQGRWGDYSNLTVDPADDCTFWVTNEYLEAADVVLGSWRTRIGAFKFPDCQAPTAVAVTTFSARWAKAGVSLAWRTGNEARIAGFHVWRASGKSWHKVNRTLVAAKKTGSAAGGFAYRLLDRNARRDRHYTYRLQIVDLKGKPSWYGAGSVPVR
jgi:hypothetical protein